jgi:hypothetical protein
MVIYVTNEDPNTCGTTLASAAACEYDAGTNRPLAGNIILCAADPANYENDVTTAVHELLHVAVRPQATPASLTTGSHLYCSRILHPELRS